MSSISRGLVWGHVLCCDVFFWTLFAPGAGAGVLVHVWASCTGASSSGKRLARSETVRGALVPRPSWSAQAGSLAASVHQGLEDG